jgi:hypothetical protein
MGGALNCSDSELCTYLQALVEGYLPTYYSDTNQCVQSRSMDIASKSYQQGKKTIAFPGFQSLAMSRPLTENRGGALLMSYQEDFHAKTYQPQAMETELMGSDLASGHSLQGSLARFDPVSFTWKTVQLSLFEDLEQSLETWPRWGLMLHGVCWELTSPVLTTGETESGLLPTPLATDWKGGTTAARKDNGKLRFDQWRDYIKLEYGMTYPHPTHSELRMGWPTEWTDLKPLGMDRFQAWQQQHSVYCEADE